MRGSAVLGLLLVRLAVDVVVGLLGIVEPGGVAEDRLGSVLVVVTGVLDELRLGLLEAFGLALAGLDQRRERGVDGIVGIGGPFGCHVCLSVWSSRVSPSPPCQTPGPASPHGGILRAWPHPPPNGPPPSARGCAPSRRAGCGCRSPTPGTGPQSCCCTASPSSGTPGATSSATSPPRASMPSRPTCAATAAPSARRAWRTTTRRR